MVDCSIQLLAPEINVGKAVEAENISCELETSDADLNNKYER